LREGEKWLLRNEFAKINWNDKWECGVWIEAYANINDSEWYLRGKRVIESNPHIRRNFVFTTRKYGKAWDLVKFWVIDSYRSEVFLSISGVDQRFSIELSKPRRISLKRFDHQEVKTPKLGFNEIPKRNNKTLASFQKVGLFLIVL
jgi:hypothetical protein